jgi:hypothetical protein
MERREVDAVTCRIRSLGRRRGHRGGEDSARLEAVRRPLAGPALVFLASMLGCSPHSFDVRDAKDASVAASSEDLRITVIGERTDTDSTGTHTRTVTCVEPVGPAMLLQNFNAKGAIGATGNTTVSGGGKGSLATSSGTNAQLEGSAATGASTDINAAVALGTTQAVGRVYEVGEIMQLVQTMSFRYCEAYANGTIGPEEYITATDNLENRAESLMSLEMAYQAQSALANEQSAKQTAADSATAARAECQKKLTTNGGTSATGTCSSVSSLESFLGEQVEAPGTKRRVPRSELIDSTSRDAARAAARAAEAADQRATASDTRMTSLNALLATFPKIRQPAAATWKPETHGVKPATAPVTAPPQPGTH